MYSKQEASLLTQQFWTSFGQYIAPVLSAEEERINWVNYKTGEKHIRFLMMADTKTAKISISLSHKEPNKRLLYFDKFQQLKKSLHQVTGEDWKWNPEMMDPYGKVTSEIFILIEQVNVLNKEDWPAIISFFKPRMIALDKFWSEYKYAFEHV